MILSIKESLSENRTIHEAMDDTVQEILHGEENHLDMKKVFGDDYRLVVVILELAFLDGVLYEKKKGIRTLVYLFLFTLFIFITLILIR